MNSKILLEERKKIDLKRWRDGPFDNQNWMATLLHQVVLFKIIFLAPSFNNNIFCFCVEGFVS